MTYKQSFKGVMFTKHAIERMCERGIKQGDAWATFRGSDSSRYSKKKGAYIYYKTYGNQKIEVIATKDKNNEWVIISVWPKKAPQKKMVAVGKEGLLKKLKSILFS